MVGVKKTGEQIRQFILENVEKHSNDIAAFACEEFGISRQAVNRHIQKLVEQELLDVQGATRSRRYSLRPIVKWEHSFPLDKSIPEDVVWRDYVSPLLGKLPENVLDIWHYGVTEMFNNALDHSSGREALVSFNNYATKTEIRIIDDGEGIFKKIQHELGLHDERHSVLELAKGKLTTDPAHHSGEGIFFSSRLFDTFIVVSGSVHFSHNDDEGADWIVENETSQPGTTFIMSLANHATRTMREIFDKFTSGDDYGFTKTIVPVRLAQYGDDKLISRSQAKRLVVRFEKFKWVILDFTGVESIGQAFADEIFRVFSNQHPEVQLTAIDANEAVQQMINRAKS